MAYSARNRAFGDAWRAQVMEPARRALTAMMERGERIGALRPGIDHEVGLALLLGPMIYRHVFVKRTRKPLPKHLETYVADAFLAIFGAHAVPPVP